jgi:hypothetical protein
MRIDEARKAFLSGDNFDFIIDRIQSLGIVIDKLDANSIFGVMKKLADNPKTFSTKNNLREVDEETTQVIVEAIKKQRMIDQREEMTKRVISEESPLNTFFVPKKNIRIPTLLELVTQGGDDASSSSTSGVSSGTGFVSGNSGGNGGEVDTSGGVINANISSLFGLNYDQFFVKNQTRSIPLLLDSRNRNLVESNVYERDNLSWNYTIGSRFEQGAALSNRTINNIVSIKCSSLLFPNYVPEQTNEFRQITMFIREFSDQGGYITSKTRAHFLYDVEYIGNRLRLSSPSGVENLIKFEKPISSLNVITIYFASPFDKIIFGLDRINSGITITKSIGVGQATAFTTLTKHNLNNGDIVYLEGFTTGDAIADNTVIVYAGRDAGHIISNVSDYYFEVSTLDTNAITGTATVGTIIYGSKRFIIPLTFNCLSI